MITNPDLDSFVCCALCSQLLPPLPSDATCQRIREYKPFRTRFYTHCDILKIGADVQQKEEEKREAEVQELIEKMKADLLSQAQTHEEEALKEAAAKHSAYVQQLTEELGEELKEAVKKAKAETQQYMEDQQKREVEATEQRMAYKLECALQECAQEKMRAVEEARKQERVAALEEAASQHREHIKQLQRESALAEEQYQMTIEKLKEEKTHKVNTALMSQKESQTEDEKERKEAESVCRDELEKVKAMLEAAEEQVKTLTQKLEKMTDWKDMLEAEIQETRQAFQKYIDATFPNLSPGQADFILPVRKLLELKNTPKAAEDSDKESES